MLLNLCVTISKHPLLLSLPNVSQFVLSSMTAFACDLCAFIERCAGIADKDLPFFAQAQIAFSAPGLVTSRL